MDDTLRHPAPFGIPTSDASSRDDDTLDMESSDTSGEDIPSPFAEVRRPRRQPWNEGPITDRRSLERFIARLPRHRATGVGRLWIETKSGENDTVTILPAQLINFSRQGLQLRLTQSLARYAQVIVRIEEETRGVNLTVAAHVRWVMAEPQGLFTVGCELESTVSWEGLGELFLAEMLEH